MRVYTRWNIRVGVLISVMELNYCTTLQNYSKPYFSNSIVQIYWHPQVQINAPCIKSLQKILVKPIWYYKHWRIFHIILVKIRESWFNKYMIWSKWMSSPITVSSLPGNNIKMSRLGQAWIRTKGSARLKKKLAQSSYPLICGTRTQDLMHMYLSTAPATYVTLDKIVSFWFVDDPLVRVGVSNWD